MRERKRSFFNAENVTKVGDTLRDHVRKVCEELRGGQPFMVDKVTLTYGELVSRSGVGIAQGQKPYLDAVAALCKENGEPSLDCLVVNRKTKRPGAGFRSEVGSWEDQVRSCFGA